MYIKSISFETKNHNNNSWKIDNFEFNKINLIAGKNSSGKSRVLSVIYKLVHLIRGQTFDIYFHKWEIFLKLNHIDYTYKLEIKDSKVFYEELLIEGKRYFQRDKNGKGKIQYESQDSLELDFEIENNKLLLASRRDKAQHPSLESIFSWIESAYIFKFGTKLGQDLAYDTKDNMIGYKDDGFVVYKFQRGLEKFGNKFKNKIINDFNGIGYNISDITIKYISSTRLILKIKENKVEIGQGDISQGMFRALSLIIQITYLEFTTKDDITILIDDIGEGLDFERANNLIKYLIKNAEAQKDKLQLIMTTNDRLVMNNVPLEYWIIVDKDDNGKMNFYSEKTHSKVFKKFKRIGLTNFDFFSSEYYKEQ